MPSGSDERSSLLLQRWVLAVKGRSEGDGSAAAAADIGARESSWGRGRQSDMDPWMILGSTTGMSPVNVSLLTHIAMRVPHVEVLINRSTLMCLQEVTAKNRPAQMSSRRVAQMLAPACTLLAAPGRSAFLVASRLELQDFPEVFKFGIHDIHAHGGSETSGIFKRGVLRTAASASDLQVASIS